MKPARFTRSLLLLPLTLVLAPHSPAHAASTNPDPFCARLGHGIEGSSGAQMFCLGAQPNGRSGGQAHVTTLGSNVDAANPLEDISPAGVRGYGQSETSIAAAGPYVVEAWNDAAGFFSPCPSPQYKEELTGLGFSADGGTTFTDLGGLPNSPNSNCNTFRYAGDPSVEVWQSRKGTYFYISSLYVPAFPLTGAPPPPTQVFYIALSACLASGAGAAAALSCSQPILAAQSTACFTPPPQPGSTKTKVCSFLDKDFMALDPARGRLYVSYTDFDPDPATALSNGQIELAVCDIGRPDGKRGPGGGTPGAPVCTQPKPNRPTAPPYQVVEPAHPSCANEGAYPAVDEATGDVYVAWEFNLGTNLGPAIGASPVCQSIPTQNKVALVPFSCLRPADSSACGPPSTKAAVPIVSLDAALIPGYNRIPSPKTAGANDFPRIAVRNPAGTVSIVWNDARENPGGDILLQSYALGSLAPVQASPVRLNPDTGGWHVLPALRYANQSGRLSVSYYQRASPNTALTNVDAVLGVDPRTTNTPAAGAVVTVTTAPSDWSAVSSDIIPNFGDYTDNYVERVATAPFNGTALYTSWTDGRLGVSQPFAAQTGTG